MADEALVDAYARLLAERLTRILAGLDKYEPEKISERTVRYMEQKHRKSVAPND